MKERILKISWGLAVLLMLDLIKPFSYWLYTEFLFLGIIFLALNYPLRVSFMLACVFGYLRGCLSYPVSSLSLIEFALVVILVHYLRARFQQRAARIGIVFAMLAVHVGLNSAQRGGAATLFILLFFIHSFWVFVLLNYLFRKWTRVSLEEYI